MGTKSSASTTLSEHLRDMLIDLHQQPPYPHIPNPPHCKKRASVAAIIRVRSSHSGRPGQHVARKKPGSSTKEQLEDFLSQDWVKHGDPELLCIKRAPRVGDRWTGHVALPGGKRDPEDPEDVAVAIRETREEVGLDISSECAICVHNLPERVITTSWGSVPYVCYSYDTMYHTDSLLN